MMFDRTSRAFKAQLLSVLMLGALVYAADTGNMTKQRLLNEKRLEHFRRRMGAKSKLYNVMDFIIPLPLKKVDLVYEEGNNDSEEVHKHRGSLLAFGAIMSALSGGLLADKFREVMNDLSVDQAKPELSFDVNCALVLVFALFGSWALRKALFSDYRNDKPLTRIFGHIFIHGAVATATLSMFYMDTMTESYFTSSSAVFLYITGGLLLSALLLAAFRMHERDCIKGSTLGHGACATMLVAGAALVMNNLREALGDTAEHVFKLDLEPGSTTTDVDFSTNNGISFIMMNVCMSIGLLWICYMVFIKPLKLGDRNWFGTITLGLGCAAVVGAGVLTGVAMSQLGEVTAEQAMNFGKDGMSINDFVSHDCMPQMMLIIAAGLLAFAFISRLIVGGNCKKDQQVGQI